MAYDMSHLWHLSDAQLLAHFEANYAQSQPWQLCTLRLPMHSALIFALLRMRVTPQLVLNAPTPMITPASSGSPSACPGQHVDPFLASVTDLCPYLQVFAQNDIATATLPKIVSPSDLDQWQISFVPLARQWPAWGPQTGVSSRLRQF
jgi:hypothetical protein